MAEARERLWAAAALVAGAGPALAAPLVMADIAPVQSIAAAVMAGLGEPGLVLPPGASPHGHALRPSEAAALQDADLVVWVGPALTPWLAGPLDALAGDAGRLTLESAPGMRLLPARRDGPFDADDHGHDHGHDGGDEGGGDEGGGGVDPHLWLDPRNAAAAAAAIATALGALDPENAPAYAANAESFGAEMAALEAELAAGLAPLRGRPYFVFHDAYHYFEDRFGLPAAGAIALGDAEPPRAGRLAGIRARFETEAVVCVFAEPQFEPRLIATLTEGAETRTGTLDPIGAGLAPGKGLYPALLRGLAADFAACIAPDP